jgi:DNA-binding NarL/FixJ family response regulator
MKLELTKEQIDQLTKVEIEKLNAIYTSKKEKLEAKFKSDLSKLDELLKADKESLKGKFKFIEYSGKVKKLAAAEKKTRVRLDDNKIKELVEQKKSVKEIASELNTTEASIRSKLGRLKIKLTD